MLSYDIRALEHDALRVDGDLAADDPVWMNDDLLPDRAVHATGRLSKAGAGRYYWSGHIDGTATVPCRRCLSDATTRVSEDVHLLFVETGDEVADDPDTFHLDPRAQEIDLRPAVREQWLIAVPGFAVCREECKGLCPRCGSDLNAGPCDCPPPSDSRWDAMRDAFDQR